MKKGVEEFHDTYQAAMEIHRRGARGRKPVQKTWGRTVNDQLNAISKAVIARQSRYTASLAQGYWNPPRACLEYELISQGMKVERQFHYRFGIRASLSTADIA